VASILDKLNSKEAARFEQQILIINDAFIKLGRRRIKIQLLPLGKPDSALKRRYIKKKTYGKADARGLTGAELTDRAFVIKEREKRAAKQVKTTTPDYSDGEGLLLIPDTPPRQQ
jgi:hypothetical protein